MDIYTPSAATSAAAKRKQEVQRRASAQETQEGRLHGQSSGFTGRWGWWRRHRRRECQRQQHSSAFIGVTGIPLLPRPECGVDTSQPRIRGRRACATLHPSWHSFFPQYSATKRLPHFSRGVLDWRAPQYLSGARRGSAAPSPRAR